MEETTATLMAAGVGFAGGGLLGLAARLGKFCTLAAIEDAIFGQNQTRWRMWLLAMAVAIFTAALAEALGLIDPKSALVIASGFNPVSTVVGGVLFGIGMALVGTCGFGTVVRLGGGDLKSLLVFLILGGSAFMASSGPTALLHNWLLRDLAIGLEALPDPRIHTVLSNATGVDAFGWQLAIALAIAAWALCGGEFRNRPKLLAWGILVGGVIVFGWIGTSMTGVLDPFNPQPVQSFTFVQPVGSSLMYVMTSTGSQLGFGIGSVAGVLVGAFCGAWSRRELRWETHDDAREARRQIIGAFLMGTGGMYALGCTFGQGLSAVSLLAISAPLALAAIWLGAWLGLLVLMEGSLAGVWGLIRPSRGHGKAPAE
ncbi:MAG: YeeE/YedE family protein [Alphaproteobacteria bacterium]|nr:YeeE/YedE family protein [Alphaproteobacteria bacterium]